MQRPMRPWPRRLHQPYMLRDFCWRHARTRWQSLFAEDTVHLGCRAWRNRTDWAASKLLLCWLGFTVTEGTMRAAGGQLALRLFASAPVSRNLMSKTMRGYFIPCLKFVPCWSICDVVDSLIIIMSYIWLLRPFSACLAIRFSFLCVTDRGLSSITFILFSSLFTFSHGLWCSGSQQGLFNTVLTSTIFPLNPASSKKQKGNISISFSPIRFFL